MKTDIEALYMKDPKLFLTRSKNFESMPWTGLTEEHLATWGIDATRAKNIWKNGLKDYFVKYKVAICPPVSVEKIVEKGTRQLLTEATHLQKSTPPILTII